MINKTKPLHRNVAMGVLAFCALTSTAATMIFLHTNVQEHIIHLPLEVQSDGLPRLTMEINGKTTQFILDTGTIEAMHLMKEYMLQIPELLVLSKKAKVTDLTGKIFYNDRFTIKSLSINGMPFTDVGGISYQKWGLTLSKEADISPDEMVVGLGLFKERSIIIDYKNQSLIIANKFADLDIDTSHGWMSLPFKFTKEGLMVKVKKDAHEYGMVLDTGSSFPIIFKDKLKSQNFVSCNKANYEINISSCAMSQLGFINLPSSHVLDAIAVAGDFKHIPFDGLIGRNFFEQYAIAIDFAEQRIFVKPN